MLKKGLFCLFPMAWVHTCGRPTMNLEVTLPSTDFLCLDMTTLVMDAPPGKDASTTHLLRKPFAGPLWSTAQPGRRW